MFFSRKSFIYTIFIKKRRITIEQKVHLFPYIQFRCNGLYNSDLAINEIFKEMKKLVFFLLLCIAMLASCSKEDDEQGLFSEPFFKAGVSKEYVTLIENRILSEQNDSISIYSPADNNYSFEDKISYAFRGDSLIASLAQLKSNSIDRRIIQHLLEKRYTPLSVDNKINFYCNQEKNVLVVLSDDETLGLNVLYMPYKLNDNNAEGAHSIHSLYTTLLSKFKQTAEE